MTTSNKRNKSFHGLESISIAQLDELLADDALLDRHILEVLPQLGSIPIESVYEPPPRPDSRLRPRFLTAAEEIEIARRIEFLRRRLSWTASVARVPDNIRRQYLDTIDGADEFVGQAAPRGRHFTETDIRQRWYEYLRMRNRLIEANLTLVERLALRYRTYGIPTVDLVQHGNLGLIRAADKFDWRKKVRFRTYAEWWIRQAIERATDTDRDVIHVPRPMRQKISKANHLNRAAGGTIPMDAGRFSELMGVERSAAARVFSIKSGIASLERSGPDDSQPIKNDLIGPDLSGRADVENLEHLRTRLDTMMDELPERERKVINLRYGLGGESPRTLEEVGEILHISRERVRQLQMRAIGHLRLAAPDPRIGFGS